MKDSNMLRMELQTERSARSREACSEPPLIDVARTSGATKRRECVEE